MAASNHSSKNSDLLMFSNNAGADAPKAEEENGLWKLMVIDDDESMHSVTSLVLDDFSYHGRKLQILDGYSGDDLRRLLDQHPDTAVLLLDVVMETEDAGLEAVKYIREELKNNFIRIILRTGQPGKAPEKDVITQYDINDYKEKSDLTALKLNTSIIVALRTYEDLKKIQRLASSNDTLEQLVKERTAKLSDTNLRLENEIEHRAESEQRLAEAQRIANIGNWEWNLSNDEMLWSDQTYKILHSRQDSNKATYKSFLSAFHPDDMEAIIDAHRAALKDPKGTFSLEHRVLTPDGTILYVCQQGEIAFDEKGKPIRLSGTLQNITERHETTEAMRKLSVVVEQIADAIMITDRVGVIEYVNPAFEDISGYMKSEVIGKSPKILKSGMLNDAFYERLWKTILKGEVFSDVIVNRRKDGSYYYEEKTITPQKDELGNITHFISTGKDITDRMENQRKLYHLAHHDPLTGLPNRVLLQDRLEQAIPRVRWHKRNIGILFLDLDRFKIINDSLGHDAGDLLLKEVAERFSKCVREGDTVARLGGDEFAIILNDIACKDDVTPIAENLIKTLAVPFNINNRELYISTSIGIALFPQDGKTSKVLLKKADIAMYQGKANGGGAYFFYSEVADSEAIERLSMETKLRHALEQEEFHLHYQPQVDLKTGEIVGKEALLRWSNPEYDFISPAQFIPILEDTGLIIPVGLWVLRQACLDEMSRQKAGLSPLRVAVNISIRQFNQSQFVSDVEKIIKETGIDPEHLELEVTEGLLIENISETARILHELHDLGVLLAIDDFGTGYSSMNYIKRLPFDMLKIDQSFVQDVTKNTDDAAIASAIITMAHQMDLGVIAEGVETIDQLEFLAQIGCEQIQGYLCSRPIPFDDIHAFENLETNISQCLISLIKP
jgi:diguanylate cyclase (GGDEF)-like protein/PAS domain S-box-containing protein